MPDPKKASQNALSEYDEVAAAAGMPPGSAQRGRSPALGRHD
jgi:hypothetical protein